MLQAGYDIRTVQELLGNREVSTTMIYTHVLNRGGRGVRIRSIRFSGQVEVRSASQCRGRRGAGG